MKVEEQGLSEGRRPDKGRLVIDLGTSLKTTAAAHAAGERISELASVIVLRLSHSKVIGAVNGNPSFRLLQVFEHLGPVNEEIPNKGKLLHRLECHFIDPVFQLGNVLDQGRASLAHSAVNIHGTGPAYLFQASGFPNGRLNGLALTRDWVALGLP